MRLPVPDRFGAKPTLLFCASVFIGQQLVGTDLIFSLLFVVFIILSVLAFNIAGGLLFPSGAFVFFNATLTCIVGLTVKIFLLQPGEKYLFNGRKTMLCYCAGMFSTLIASALNARLRPRVGLLAGSLSLPLMKRAAIGSFWFGGIATILFWNSGDGSVGSAFRQINHFLPMSIMLATTYEFYRSGGKKSTNWVVFAASLGLFAQGLLYFGKQAMFTGPVSWLIPAILLGYSFSKRQILGFALGGFLLLHYMVPYSQYVRGFAAGNLRENYAIAIKYLSDLGETRRLYLAQLGADDKTDEPHLYDTSYGFLDRMNMIAFDDSLIHYTDQGNVYGLLPTFYSYVNIVPHFIWADKPTFAYGNVFGREIGVIDESDDTTGISFSAVGDAYHEATWFGLLAVWPVVAFLFFFATDSLTGSARYAPWAFLPITLLAHAAPEGMMLGIIFLGTYGIAIILSMFIFSRYLLPLVTGVLLGTDRTQVKPLLTQRPTLRPGPHSPGPAGLVPPA